MTSADTLRTINAIFRIEQAKLVAGTARIVKDVGLAEEIVQEALVAALERWPAQGLPENPGAWLMTTSKRPAIDILRRTKRTDPVHEALGRDLAEEERAMPELDAALDND